jgi:hypothetical protein
VNEEGQRILPNVDGSILHPYSKLEGSMEGMILGVVLCFGPVDAVAQQGKAEPIRVAAIYIEGNVVTRDQSIHDELKFYPGQLMPSEADLLKAEIRLLMKFHKRFDLDAGKRPRIEVLPADFETDFRDVRVSFPEKERKRE